MTTLMSDLVAQVRTRLEEATARKWSDADQIIPYLSRAERRMAGWLSRLPQARRFRKTHESITVSAGSETFDLTTLAKPFDWLIQVSVLFANVEIPLVNYETGEEPYLHNLELGGGIVVSRVDIVDDVLWLLPKFGSARTCYVDYGWLPAAKTSAGSSIETPVKYDGYLVEWALHYALADAGLANDKFEEELAADRSEIEELEGSRRGTNRQRVLSRARTFARCR